MSPSRHPGTSNLRLRSKSLVGGLVAAIVVIGIGLKIGAEGRSRDSGEMSILEDGVPTIDGEIPTLEPEAGPEIAPKPTTMASLPLPLDPVVTTIPTTTLEPPDSHLEALLMATEAITVKSLDGESITLPLPPGWVDSGNGNARSKNGGMYLYLANVSESLDKTLEFYKQEVLGGALLDPIFSDFKNFTSSSYSSIGYFMYEGIDTSRGASKVIGFVWIGTTTSGRTWIVDFNGPSSMTDRDVSPYFKYVAALFGRVLAE